jgi:hypothetical protein
MNKRILVIEEPTTSENSQLPALAAEIGYLQCTSGRRSTWPALGNVPVLFSLK